MYVLLSDNLIISISRKNTCTARETNMGKAGANFHSLPPTCLTIYLIMPNVPVNYIKLLYNSIVDKQILILL